MPRAAVTEQQKKTAAVTGVIVQYMKLRGVDDDYMAKSLGIRKETWKKKLNHSGEFWVKELITVSQILQIPLRVNFFIGVVPQDESLAYQIANLLTEGGQA